MQVCVLREVVNVLLLHRRGQLGRGIKIKIVKITYKTLYKILKHSQFMSYSL